MTDVKRLLEEAIQEHQGCACSGLYGHLRGRGIVVQVVNSLPAYEAAVEALERLLDHHENTCRVSGGPGAECVVRDDAREALRRLREGVPA